MKKDFWRKKPIKEFNTEQTMYSLVTDEAKNDLDLDAVSFMGSSMKYKELFTSSDDLAKAFKSMGVKEDDNVAILTINMPLVQQSLLALSKIGATMSWIDLRTQEQDLINYINNGKSKVVVVFDEMLPLIENIIDDINVERVIVCSPKEYLNPAIRFLANLKDKKEGKKIEIPSDDRFVKFSDFIKEGKNTSSVSTANFKEDRPSLIIQSSGSTGKAKQIVHSEKNVNSQVQKMAYLDFPFYKGNTMFVAVPPFIIYGLANSIYSSLAFTMNAEMCPFVENNIVYNGLGKFDISFAVPLHYRYIYEQLNKLKNDIKILENSSNSNDKKKLKEKLKEFKRIVKGLERAQLFGSGGDKISTEEVIEMQQAFNTPIANGFGNNECLGPTIVTPMYVNKPGTVGIPMHGVEIKFVNSDTGEEVKKGEPGELYVSSDNLFLKYLNNEEETKRIKVTDENGKQWVKTGDICVEDQDGFIIPMGRSRRLIISDGFKISPDTIEETLMTLNYIKDCVVVGVPDEELGNVPMAFIELEDNYSINDVLEDIKEKCSKTIPQYEIPKYFEQIDEIPYTQNGKHDFRKLEELGNEYIENIKKDVKNLQKSKTII